MKGMIDTPSARHWFMHTPHAAIGLAATIKTWPARSLQADVAPLPPLPRSDTRFLRVGLVIGSEASQELAATRLADYLVKDQSLRVSRAWECIELGIDDSSDYDCLVLLGWPAASNAQQIKRIELYCRGGGSLVALRAMQANFSAWPNFSEEVLGGRQPRGQPCRLMEVGRSDAAWHHPVLQGVEAMFAEGEFYCGPRLSPDTTTVLVARVGRRTQPVAWIRRHEGGRVFCTTLGVNDDFREPDFLRLVSNAIHWTGPAHPR
jgi:hypothetical protein